MIFFACSMQVNTTDQHHTVKLDYTREDTHEHVQILYQEHWRKEEWMVSIIRTLNKTLYTFVPLWKDTFKRYARKSEWNKEKEVEAEEKEENSKRYELYLLEYCSRDIICERKVCILLDFSFFFLLLQLRLCVCVWECVCVYINMCEVSYNAAGMRFHSFIKACFCSVAYSTL